MAFTWTPVIDGDVLDAATLNAIFQNGGAQTGANNIASVDIRKAAFNEMHRMPMVFGQNDIDDYQRVELNERTYTFAVFGEYLGYTQTTDYSANPNVLVGTDSTPVTGGATVARTWVCIGHPDATGAGTLFRTLFDTPFRLDNDGAGFIGGILCGLNIDVVGLSSSAEVVPTDVIMCIQYLTDQSAFWIPVKRTIIPMNLPSMILSTQNPSDFRVNCDFPLRCLITIADLDEADSAGYITDAATAEITGVRACVAIVDDPAGCTLTLGEGNFSSVPIRLEVA